MNYDLLMRREIERLGGSRPRLLLHSCCAPCSVPALERLAGHFDLTIFYCNPNMVTIGEFEKRLSELKRPAFSHRCEIIVQKYDHGEFLDAVRGFESEPEGGERCKKCFELRFRHAAEEAKRGGYDRVASTLTTGPRKDAHTVNSCGEPAARDAGVAWLPADFKKRGGYQRSVEVSKNLGIYRQDFCGCEFSRTF